MKSSETSARAWIAGAFKWLRLRWARQPASGTWCVRRAGMPSSTAGVERPADLVGAVRGVVERRAEDHWLCVLLQWQRPTSHITAQRACDHVGE
jgi:hypothetical protein